MLYLYGFRFCCVLVIMKWIFGLGFGFLWRVYLFWELGFSFRNLVIVLILWRFFCVGYRGSG